MNQKQKIYFDRILNVKNKSTCKRQKKLIDIVLYYRFLIKDIAELVGVNKHTVQGWLASETKKYYRRIQQTTLDNIIFRLKYDSFNEQKYIKG